MTRRDLEEDLLHAQPLAELPAMRAQVAESPMVWHAMLLPISLTGEPKFVLTGHINCHDCALCSVAGDLRDGGGVVPWRNKYPDCTSTEEEYDSYYGYNDAIDGMVPVPASVREALFAAYYVETDGGAKLTGWVLNRAVVERVDEWAMGLTEVAASRPSLANMVVEYLFTRIGTPTPPELNLMHMDFQ